MLGVWCLSSRITMVCDESPTIYGKEILGLAHPLSDRLTKVRLMKDLLMKDRLMKAMRPSRVCISKIKGNEFE